MREIYIDLSEDICHSSIFGGYIGEHNETKITTKLPARMLTDDITKYQFIFKNYKNEIQPDNVVDLSDINNGNVSTLLTEEQTVGNCLIFSVTATVENGGIVERRTKTPIVSLKVRE